MIWLNIGTFFFRLLRFPFLGKWRTDLEAVQDMHNDYLNNKDLFK